METTPALRLNFPAATTPADWLAAAGAEPPSLLPSWPPPPGMALVVVFARDDGTTAGFRADDRARLDALAVPTDGVYKLFFVVPAAALAALAAPSSSTTGGGDSSHD